MRLRFQCSKSTDNTKIYVSTAARQRKPLVLKGEDGKTYIARVEGIKAILRLQDEKGAAKGQ
jgi:hypothetical protein